MDKKTLTFVLGWAKKIRAIRLLGGQCENCCQANPLVLEFHHDDKTTKRWDVGSSHNKRWSELEKEIQKCRLLCRNCHRKLHAFGTARNLKAKTTLLQVKGVSACSQCGYSGNIAVLDFHHRDETEKQFKVNSCDIRRPHIQWEDVLAEINKTDVLCANCHLLCHSQRDRFYSLENEILNAVENHQEIQPRLDVNVVSEMLSKGMRQIDIARQLGCAKSTICEIIKRHNLAHP